MPEIFSNAEMLRERFGGRWPSFHDAEILRIELSRIEEVILLLDIFVFARSAEVDSQGYFARENATVVRLAFRRVWDITLSDFNEQNVLQDLLTSMREDGSLRVEICSLYGLSGSFLCSEAAVADVRGADNIPPSNGSSQRAN
jgi:hypothetical protein